jgi:hypothetical protein
MEREKEKEGGMRERVQVFFFRGSTPVIHAQSHMFTL